MALNWKWDGKMGKCTIKQRDKEFILNIYDCNALALFLSEWEAEGESRYQMYTFFVDRQHCKNILKNGGKLIPDEVVSIELNIAYPHAKTLLDILVKNGYKVTAYYEKVTEYYG